MTIQRLNRRLPVGAEIAPTGGVDFRVWAPRCRRVEVVFEPTDCERLAPVELSQEQNGYFSGNAPAAGAGALYRFRLDQSATLYPDPASRSQPQGPHGPARVVDPGSFSWSDSDWSGVSLLGQVIYEMHLGTFTQEGTWQAAARQLPDLVELGVTVLEIMPLADFPGRHGWGYDGVNLFAPSHLYGSPDDARRFIDQAHTLGLGVIHDVVYNHFGPDGNYLNHFSEDYFTDRYKNEWGQAINFDGPRSEPVREFFIANAGYWIDEFHFDGLRLDATQQIFDNSRDSILTAVTRRVREAARGRATIVVAENEPQHARLVRPVDNGGHGMDGLWNDDFHHSAMVALTGHHEAYYTDYLGKPQEFISALKYGFLYQGQQYSWQKNRRGAPTFGIKPSAFITFLQNHDQVANSARGLRCHVGANIGQFKALTALFLLGPGTPMLFQGQEFASSSPFYYFADHHPELADLVGKGRKQFLSQFPSVALPEMQAILPDPADPATFERCRLDFAERHRHAALYHLHRDLLRLRREDPVLRPQEASRFDGAVLSDQAFLLRFFGADGDDRLLLVNLDGDLRLEPAPEPLLAPSENGAWEITWSSEDPRYGGNGTAQVDTEENWRVPGHAAMVLAPIPAARPRIVK